MCHTCYMVLASNGECAECRQWRKYWDSLTPEQKAEDHRAMGPNLTIRGLERGTP